jgi:uncharacterized membrane protein YeaQ/YmgE (transglycosylase-associated protein family)
MVDFFVWLAFGLFVGIVAKLLMPGKDPGRLAGTTVIGLIGAVIGRYTGREIGLYGADDPIGFVMAIIGALMFLAVYRWFVSC